MMFPMSDAGSMIEEKFSSLWHLVGNTPMVEVVYTYRGSKRSIFAKCEYYNFTGSIKDRMALYILEHAYLEEKIRPGDPIVETTTGNAGISLAAIGRRLGHPVKVITPDWLTRERVDIIKSLGAEVVSVNHGQGGFQRSIHLAEEMAAEDPRIFLPHQFSNALNAEAHEQTTATEIWGQLAVRGLCPDAFVAGVGTGGTVMGVGRFLKMKNRSIMVHPLEPVESPALSTGCKTGMHRIYGISDEFISGIVKLGKLDSIVQVHDGDAIHAAQMLDTQLGLGVGISSGANFIGAVKVQNMLGAHACVATVFPDSNKKYLNTDLVKEEPVKEGYLSTEIALAECKPVGGVRTTNVSVL
jgi:cysteine synthase